MNTNIGMTGEFRCVVKKADGSTKIDTGYQKNLILDQGLDFFGGGNGENMMEFCIIGGGNSNPVYTQNQLDTTIAGVRGGDFSSKYDYDASIDGNLYKTNKVRKYTFNGLNNVNISEVGLASKFSSSIDYYLCTRALIKDSQGNPTTITVLSGEVLEIYYKLWQVFDTTDKVGTINLLDGGGGSVAYNYKLRLCAVGTNTYQNIIALPTSGAVNYGFDDSFVFSSDLSAITTKPFKAATIGYYNGDNYLGSDGQYTPNSFKRIIYYDSGINNTNTSFRGVVAPSSMGAYQIRFGSVADDSPITKTSMQTLSIPIEFSWGRYEGAL